MYRRRRVPAREPVFSFDSFLDLVTNVVGIIIRLILVAWVGARAYHSLQPTPVEEPSAAEVAPPTASEDPLHPEIARTRHALAEARLRLLEQMKTLDLVQMKKTETATLLAAVVADHRFTVKQRQGLEKTPSVPARIAPQGEASLSELRARSQSVLAEINALEKLPSLKKSLRYRAPVSRPVQADELMFECKGGRVTFIDIAAFLDEVKRGLGGKVEALQQRWQLEEVAGPIGAFRMRYTIERERGMLEDRLSRPEGGSFRYGLSAWVLEPIAPVRGETLEGALAAGSEFRQILAGQDLTNTVVTFWVYPDSFAQFRTLRDELYERGAEVAARPLTDGQPIAASRHGTASRGQ
jgi:hypothetical protein